MFLPNIFTDELPSEQMLKAVHELIDYGVAKQIIKSDYILYGHRQVRDTECPGDRLYKEIQTWTNWKAVPENNEVET